MPLIKYYGLLFEKKKKKMELVYRGREIAFEEVCGIFSDPLPVEQLKKSIQEYELMKQDEAKYCIS